MSILITLLKAPDSNAASIPSMSFDESGGSIGRGEENTWVLEDPELYLSSLHCEICFENGQYYIIDRSTNGTFYNGSVDPMGKGSRLPVHNDDRFIIGDYEFAISMQSQSQNLGLASDPFSSGLDELSPNLGGSLDNFADSPFEAGLAAVSDPLFSSAPSDSDPLAALDKARGGSDQLFNNEIPESGNNPFPSTTQSDTVDPLNQQMDWPKSSPGPGNSLSNVIPDDWDVEAEELLASSQAKPDKQVSEARTESKGPGARERALEIVNQKLLAQIKKLKSQQNMHDSDGTAESYDVEFIRALGLHNRNLSRAEIEQTSRKAGEVMRAMISGLMQVLSSRSSIKNEFRMNVTTIQPVENNPLKFSANVDDALENMFLKSGNAFKQPLDAVNEGFDSVAEHQVAILAGIREAFKGVIERFDPIVLEERFSKQSRGGILPGSQKAKNWEAFASYYEELVGDIDKSFQYLFGDGFVRAYEDQLQKLAISKKSRASNKNPPPGEPDQT
ncbi:MAG: type VI secretion system-associated FHA domain protein TagH [Gammaproteobacteria bacterium]|nr:type VI secretion system-associated FHA domain protein TagH [Gammaproteobacteria bacterium]